MIKIQKIESFVNQLTKDLSKSGAKRTRQGVKAFSLGEFRSLNAAGRQLNANPQTGLSQVYRLINDASLGSNLQRALIEQAIGEFEGEVCLNIDHTKLGNFTVAIIALQTGKGRSVPFWRQVNPGSKNAAIEPLVAGLSELFESLKQINPTLKISLVGDRWFASEKLMRLCLRAGAYFLFRTKVDKIVDTPWKKGVPISEVANFDTPVGYKGMGLRLVMSSLKKGAEEAWFLLTNIDDLSRASLITKYERRFEIEATFKDIKWVQRLKKPSLKKAQSVSNLLLFIFIGWLIPYKTVKRRHLFKAQAHIKKALSWFGRIFENCFEEWRLGYRFRHT